jgi:hydroxyacylglutathione hydrolase
MQLNPFGPQDETRDRASRILEVISERSLETVCGYNFITEFDSWREDFKHLLDRARETKIDEVSDEHFQTNE